MPILITGANKGIGYETAKKYRLKGYVGDILITSRDLSLGRQALKNLQEETKEQKQPGKFVLIQLDITNNQSKSKCITFVHDNYPEGLDVLINNAGFAFSGTAINPPPFSEQARTTFAINYFGTKEFTFSALMYPRGRILKKNGRVLYCSSGITDKLWMQMPVMDRERFKNASKLNFQDLDGIAEEYLRLVEKDTIGEAPLERYVKNTYCMSKYLIRAFTEVAAKAFKNVYHFSYCPGRCRTDMSKNGITGVSNSPRSSEEGARIAYYLGVTEDKNVLENNGGFFKRDNELHIWGDDDQI